MKKSFILHYDSLSVIDKMTDEQTGKLLRMMKSYHNGRDYVCNDFAVELVFEQFRNQFDRDLIKYNNICERNSNNGKKGGRPQEPKKPSGLFGNPKKPKKADNDNDSDNDSDKENIKSINDFDLTLLEFQNMRKKIKKPMTDNAVELLKRELEKLAPGSKELQIAIMNKSIMNCWQGVFALKEEDIKNATDPIITQYEEQVKICFERGRADDRENQILTEKRKQLESKYGEKKGGEIRKNIRAKYK